MALLDVVGELFGFSDQKSWKLESLDDVVNVDIEGQFLAQNMTFRAGATLGENTTVNKDQPNFQWLHGDAETFTFTTRIYARDAFSNVSQQIRLIQGLTKRNRRLKRAPKFRFSTGTEIQFECFVRGVELVFDELRSDGSIRGAIVNLTLQKLSEDLVTEAASTSLAAFIKLAAGIVGAAAGISQTIKQRVDVPGFSPHTVDTRIRAKEGDSYEIIAQREYGDALYGDVLRRVQPDKPNLKAGDEVLILDRDEIIQKGVNPRSVPLRNNQTNLRLLENKLDQRNTTAFIL